MRTNRAKVCDLLQMSATHPERERGTIVAVRHDRYMRIDLYEDDPALGAKLIRRLSIDGLSLPQLRRILTAIARP